MLKECTQAQPFNMAVLFIFSIPHPQQWTKKHLTRTVCLLL